MMDYAIILAQAAGTAAQAQEVEAAKEIIPIDAIWQHIISLEHIEAFTFISFGVVCLFYGWRVFRILVVISFALAGLSVGIYTNKVLIGGNEIWLGILCMILFAVFSIPMMRWGVCLLGAAAGGIITGGSWLAADLPQQYIWAGALVGIIAGGMISFIVFKAAVMLFTSLGGSALMSAGILAIIYQNFGIAEKMEEYVFTEKWFLPAMLMLPAIAGIILQSKFIKSSKNFDI
jgi:hypothetical protein